MSYGQTPHMAQWAIHDRLVRILLRTIEELDAAGLPRRLLELGAGHGALAPYALAAGWEATVVDMSPASLEHLRSRYGANDRLRTIDPEAGLDATGDGYALALCVSVLHHVPDYVSLVDLLADRVAPGGAVLTMEDPLWYPRVGRVKRSLDRGAYLAWRIARGNVAEGLAAMRRRLRGEYPPDEPGTIVYHHVVRQGVDEEAVARRLQQRFAEVEVMRYWSHHLAASRVAAERAGLANTFATRARGRVEA